MKKQNWAVMRQEQPGSEASQFSQQGFCQESSPRRQEAKKSTENHSETNKKRRTKANPEANKTVE